MYKATDKAYSSLKYQTLHNKPFLFTTNFCLHNRCIQKMFLVVRFVVIG